MGVQKVMAIVALTMMLGASGVILAPNKVEAFGLGNIGQLVGKSLGVNISVDGLTNQQNDMLQQLGNSTILLNSSTLDVMQALNMNPELISAQQLAYNNLKSDNTNLDFQKASVELEIPSEDVKVAAKSILDSGDKDQIAALNSSIKSAENKRIAADICMALASRDAVSILKNATAGINSGNNLDAFQQLFTTTQTAQQIIKLQGKQIKALNTALADYKKTQNIKEPNKNDPEVKAAIDGLKNE